jgi:hypothetical protein
VIILANTFFILHAARVGELVLKYRLPTIGYEFSIVETGGFMAYNAKSSDLWRRAATFVDKIDPQGRRARRSTDRATHQVRVDHQPENREDAGADDPAVAAVAGGSGHRVMDRRTFLYGMTITALAAPLVVEGQQAGKVYRISFLFIGFAPTPATPSSGLEAFRHRLRELGYMEGANVVFEYRFIAGNPERLRALAVELVRLNPDVIVTRGSSAAAGTPLASGP